MSKEHITLQRMYYREGVKIFPRNVSPKEVFKDGSISDLRALLTYTPDHIDYKEVQTLKKALTTDEIIAKLGGGDLTDGSCCSLAWAYAGNKLGLDVTDYRGGISRYTFSVKANNRLIRLMAKDGVVTSVDDYNDIKGATKLLNMMEEGKEYCLQTGGHASIVRKVATGFEYLELQTISKNGFTPFNPNTLKDRFGCKRSHTMHGRKYMSSSMLIDISALQEDEGVVKEFQKILGYLNTASGEQKKGVGGHAK